MPTTAYVDMVSAVAALQARTDSGGSPVTDVNGEEIRLIADILDEGVLSLDGYLTVPGAGLSVDVGSNSEKDLAVIDGLITGQGRYLVRVGTVPHNVALTAADLTFDRIDEIYVVVEDIAYDAGSRTMARLGYRTGDPASSPSAPGPDSNWEAYILIATIAVDIGVTSIVASDITDSRLFAQVNLPSRGVPGVIEMFGGVSAPVGSFLCDGQAVSRSTYARLFAVLGTGYGIGDGSTTFNVPDLRQRFPLGKAVSGTGSVLGEVGGNIDHAHSGPAHTHTGPNHSHSMPSHTHTMPTHNHTNPNTTAAGNHIHDVVIVGGTDDAFNPISSNHPQTSLEGDHVHTQGNTGVKDPGDTNATDPGDTNSAGTGNTGSSGTGDTGIENPPFQVVNFIVWA